MVFCNTRRKVDWLADQLQRCNFTVAAVHADLDQMERSNILQEFRRGSPRVLIATDSYARGIDIQALSVVVNFDLPASIETYYHRIGRCGRFGRRGIAINFVMDHDVRGLRDIEHFFSTQIEELPIDFQDLI
mmetsp:Transcript_75278/g.189412  ORF Transcript_75278/g.189412 Transcript_75278/m.189412 type:complete len:132 (+) Transcript_75278:968-1363(+)